MKKRFTVKWINKVNFVFSKLHIVLLILDIDKCYVLFFSTLTNNSLSEGVCQKFLYTALVMYEQK